MESFDINAAQLAHFSAFNPVALTVDAEFMDNDKFLDWVEDVEGINAYNGMELEEGKPHAKIDFDEACEALANTLREHDDILQASHDRTSRHTNFSSSTGNSTNRTINTKRLAKHHKDRALKNVELTNKLAAATSKMTVKDKEMDKLRA